MLTDNELSKPFWVSGGKVSRGILPASPCFISANDLVSLSLLLFMALLFKVVCSTSYKLFWFRDQVSIYSSRFMSILLKEITDDESITLKEFSYFVSSQPSTHIYSHGVQITMEFYLPHAFEGN